MDPLCALYKIDELTFVSSLFLGFQVVDTCGNVTLTASRILALAFAELEDPAGSSPTTININNTSSNQVSKSSIAQCAGKHLLFCIAILQYFRTHIRIGNTKSRLHSHYYQWCQVLLSVYQVSAAIKSNQVYFMTVETQQIFVYAADEATLGLMIKLFLSSRLCPVSFKLGEFRHA